MKKFILIIFLSITGYLAFPQSKLVVFNYDRSNFNDNLPLPYGENFVVTGPASADVSMVEVIILDEKPKKNADPLYKNVWKQSSTGPQNSFYVPISYKLQDSNYDIIINYYRKIGNTEAANVRRSLYDALDAYVEQSLVLDNEKIRLFKNTQETIDNLNSIVNSSMVYYRNNKNIAFDGFSDVVREKVKIIQDSKRKTAQQYYSALGEDEALLEYRKEQAEELKAGIHSEVDFFLNTGLSVLADSRYIDNYPVEKTRNLLTIHGGYGGVIFDVDNSEFNSDNGFYAGLSFPLGKKAFASNFWSNSAIVAGFYINNFGADAGQEISGPIFKRPTYVGLGHKIFQFIRISGGAAFLQNEDTAGELENLTDQAFIRPFIGIQADINLWLDLAN